MTTAEVVVCGAGIAGIATAYHLAVRAGVRRVVLVDERPPLSLTSDKSTECYRNWFPGPGDAVVAIMNRSIDLLEEQARESGNVFRLNRRGYLFATAEPSALSRFRRVAEEAASLGAGPLRVHATGASDYAPAPPDGFEGQPTGADLITDRGLIQRQFPYLAPDTVGLLHVRRCGWFSGQQLGMYLFERSREHGVTLVDGRVEAIDTGGGRVQGVAVQGRDGARTIWTPRVVVATGPFLQPVGRLVGAELPVYSERHLKIAFSDELGAIPRDAPMLIWADPIRLAWSEEERAELAESNAHRRLLDQLPVGVHGRPEGAAGSATVLALWNYDLEPVEPTFPLDVDPSYPEVVIRGMARMIPALRSYLTRLPRCVVDGGYYAKTRENRFLVGPLPVEGAYVVGALSGYGLMAANGVAELIGDYICERPLPPYASAFRLERYQDPAYRELLEHWGDTGEM
jgi:sarcosine oxidase, subunit beta